MSIAELGTRAAPRNRTFKDIERFCWFIRHYAEGAYDDAVTVEIKNALKTVGITPQEHVIVAPEGFYSFRKTGQLGGACG